jgi:hypothetical protein
MGRGVTLDGGLSRQRHGLLGMTRDARKRREPHAHAPLVFAEISALGGGKIVGRHKALQGIGTEL